MYLFEIKGKEHELKITLASVKYLNGVKEGGAFSLIHSAITGDIETFIDIVFAGLFHTNEGYRKADVEEAIEQLIVEEKLDLDTINKTSYGVMAESFFYKATFNKMFATDPEAKKQIEEMMK